MSAPLVWRVLAMTADADGRMVAMMTAGGHAMSCDHYHETQAHAESCPWEPVPPPAVYAGIVRRVRDDRYDRALGHHRWTQGTMPW
jgi:hypothetical protein